MDTSAAPRRRERLVTREVAGDTVIVPLAARPEEMNQIFILNPVGAFLWSKLDGSRRLEELVTLLEEEFDQADPEVLRTDVGAFVGELEALGLVAVAVAAADAKET